MGTLASVIYFDLVRRANGTQYNYGDLVAPAALNGHIYLCTTAGISAGAPPSFNTGAASTTTDGAAVWTEYNPAGLTYSATVTPAHNPKWGNILDEIKYYQPVDYSNGGDLYCYDKGVSRETQSLTYEYLLSAERTALYNLIALVRGSRYAFMYYDTAGTGYKVQLLNTASIQRIQTIPAYETLKTPLQLLFL
jgi:hypothetical protein